MCGGGIVPNVPATISDSSDPTHSVVRLTSHNLKTREPHTCITCLLAASSSHGCRSRAGLFSPCTPKAVFGEWHVLILCSLFLSIKTFEGGGAFVQVTWLSSAVISRERANSSSYPADTEGKPSGLEGGRSAANSRPATPDTTDSGRPPACCVLGDFQRGGNVALGTPGYQCEA